MELQPEEAIREAVAEAFAEHRRTIEALVPAAVIEHIGATSVPGSLTKGGLDLLVSVPAERFEQAAREMEERYEIHQPEDWTETFASFKAPEGGIPIGVQLVVADSRDERLFIEWRELLVNEPDVLAEYNALKRSQSGADPDSYVAAKGRFIEAHTT